MGQTKGDKTARAIKLMAAHCIESAVMDEADAIDGSRPLEQVADASGYAGGSKNVEMTAHVTRFKVLLMAGKGLTPGQQAGAPSTTGERSAPNLAATLANAAAFLSSARAAFAAFSSATSALVRRRRF